MINPEQLCFNTGEISPLMYGRVDLPKYQYGCKTLENMLVFLQGPTFKRPGTEFIAEVKDSTQSVRLLPFIYSADDAYVIEAGTNYMRFYRTDPDTQETGLITDSEIETVYMQDEPLDIHFDQVEDLMYLCHQNHPIQKLERHGHADWEIDDAPINDGPFLKENITDITIEPSAIDGDITLTASDDIFTENHVGALWLLTQNRPTSTVKGSMSASGRTSQSILVQENTSARATTHGTWTGTLVVEKSYDNGATWNEVSSIDSVNDENMLEEYAESIDDAMYRLRMSDYTSGTCKYNLMVLTYEWYGIVRITAFTDARNVSATVLTATQGLQSTMTTEEIYVIKGEGRGLRERRRFVRTKVAGLASTGATKRWSEGAWSAEQGYPTSLIFFQQRLFVSSKSHRQPRIWASENYNFENFFEGPDADDALYFYLATTRSNPIVWLIPSSQNIIVGTSEQSSTIQPVIIDGGLVTFGGEGGSGVIKPDSFASGMLTGNTIIFIERQKQKVYQIANSPDVLNYLETEDLSILAEHITKPYIIGMAFQQRPIPILWLWRSDGVLVSMVFSRVHNVATFATHPMGNAFVEWVTVIPSAVTNQDEVWLVVKRTINGTVRRYIERLYPIDLDAEIEDCKYLDCSLFYDGEATTTITGLGHLEGQTVSVLADGIVLDDQTVTDGQITLDTAASKVLIGLSYMAMLTTLDLQFSFQNGSTKGKKIKIPEINFDFYRTGDGVQYGYDELTEISFDSLFSGLWPVQERGAPFVSGWQKEISVTLTQTKPLPFVLRSIIAKCLIEGK